MDQSPRALNWAGTCALPEDGSGDVIELAHGDGGRLTRRLIEERILPRLGNDTLNLLADAARLPWSAEGLFVTTDSYVVSPLFFPGGDIGTLAVHGTVNDLLVAGARPVALSLSLIIEEGLACSTLDRILASIALAVRRVGVSIVAGDTKVVPRGAADGLFINTTGLGVPLPPVPPGPAALHPGDELLISGPIAQHGLAILALREGLQVDPPLASDCAPLSEQVAVLRDARIKIRAMRDATRGGVAAVCQEWARASRCTLAIEESQLPLTRQARGLCELLGLDPLHVANEGTMVVAVEPGEATRALAAWREAGHGGAAIGTVRTRGLAPVTIRRLLGAEQILDEPVGTPLPRIC